LPLLQQALPENPTPVSLLFSIRQLASESQATISALQLPKTDILSPPATQSGSAQANQVSTVTVSVSVDGTYEQVKSFFTGLTALRRIVTIESVTMSTIESGDETQPEKLVRLMTKLQAYYLPGGSL
jgi:Tfp pilus assembly protein PilO